MQPLLVVKFDIRPDLFPQLLFSTERETMVGIGLEAVEEGFHVSVVGHLPRTIHALNISQCLESVTEGMGRVFDSSI